MLPSHHIAVIVAEAHKRAGAILRDNDVPATFVCSCVHFWFFGRPLVEYNSIIWSSATIRDIDSLESVQRRFTKRLSGLKHLNCYDRLERLTLSPLSSHRNI